MAFAGRLALLVVSVSAILFTVTPGTILMYGFSLLLEAFCIWTIWFLVLDMKKPTWVCAANRNKLMQLFTESRATQSNLIYITTSTFLFGRESNRHILRD
jgi:hypothetical protein